MNLLRFFSSRLARQNVPAAPSATLTGHNGRLINTIPTHDASNPSPPLPAASSSAHDEVSASQPAPATEQTPALHASLASLPSLSNFDPSDRVDAFFALRAGNDSQDSQEARATPGTGPSDQSSGHRNEVSEARASEGLPLERAISSWVWRSGPLQKAMSTEPSPGTVTESLTEGKLVPETVQVGDQTVSRLGKRSRSEEAEDEQVVKRCRLTADKSTDDTLAQKIAKCKAASREYQAYKLQRQTGSTPSTTPESIPTKVSRTVVRQAFALQESESRISRLKQENNVLNHNALHAIDSAARKENLLDQERSKNQKLGDQLTDERRKVRHLQLAGNKSSSTDNATKRDFERVQADFARVQPERDQALHDKKIALAELETTKQSINQERTELDSQKNALNLEKQRIERETQMLESHKHAYDSERSWAQNKLKLWHPRVKALREFATPRVSSSAVDAPDVSPNHLHGVTPDAETGNELHNNSHPSKASPLSVEVLQQSEPSLTTSETVHEPSPGARVDSLNAQTAEDNGSAAAQSEHSTCVNHEDNPEHTGSVKLPSQTDSEALTVKDQIGVPVQPKAQSNVDSKKSGEDAERKTANQMTAAADDSVEWTEEDERAAFRLREATIWLALNDFPYAYLYMDEDDMDICANQMQDKCKIMNPRIKNFPFIHSLVWRRKKIDTPDGPFTGEPLRERRARELAILARHSTPSSVGLSPKQRTKYLYQLFSSKSGGSFWSSSTLPRQVPSLGDYWYKQGNAWYEMPKYTLVPMLLPPGRPSLRTSNVAPSTIMPAAPQSVPHSSHSEKKETTGAVSRPNQLLAKTSQTAGPASSSKQVPTPQSVPISRLSNVKGNASAVSRPHNHRAETGTGASRGMKEHTSVAKVKAFEVKRGGHTVTPADAMPSVPSGPKIATESRYRETDPRHAAPTNRSTALKGIAQPKRWSVTKQDWVLDLDTMPIEENSPPSTVSRKRTREEEASTSQEGGQVAVHRDYEDMEVSDLDATRDGKRRKSQSGYQRPYDRNSNRYRPTPRGNNRTPGQRRHSRPFKNEIAQHISGNMLRGAGAQQSAPRGNRMNTEEDVYPSFEAQAVQQVGSRTSYREFDLGDADMTDSHEISDERMEIDGYDIRSSITGFTPSAAISSITSAPVFSAHENGIGLTLVLVDESDIHPVDVMAVEDVAAAPISNTDNFQSLPTNETASATPIAQDEESTSMSAEAIVVDDVSWPSTAAPDDRTQFAKQFGVEQFPAYIGSVGQPSARHKAAEPYYESPIRQMAIDEDYDDPDPDEEEMKEKMKTFDMNKNDTSNDAGNDLMDCLEMLQSDNQASGSVVDTASRHHNATTPGASSVGRKNGHKSTAAKSTTLKLPTGTLSSLSKKTSTSMPTKFEGAQFTKTQEQLRTEAAAARAATMEAIEGLIAVERDAADKRIADAAVVDDLSSHFESSQRLGPPIKTEAERRAEIRAEMAAIDATNQRVNEEHVEAQKEMERLRRR